MPSADLPPPPAAVERIVLHDARAVHDSASLRYADFAPSPAGGWIIALLEPAPDSGAATVPGASLQDGRLNVPPGAEMVVQKKGRWKRQGVQGKEWPAEGSYAWHEPLDKPTRAQKPEDIYSPFVSGGVIIFRPVAGASGLAQFGKVHLVFREFAPLLPLALNYVEKQGIPPGAVPDAESLQRMATVENPMLALLGFRELAAQQELSATGLLAHLNRVRGPLRATFAYVLLLRPPEAPLVAGLEGAVDRASTADTLGPLATGAHAVVQFHPAETAAVARAKSLILRVRQRAAQLGPPFNAEESLRVMSRLAGLSP